MGQFALNAVQAQSTQLAQTPLQGGGRHFLYIKNYSDSIGRMFVAFGKPATVKLGGELELLPGGEFVYGNSWEVFNSNLVANVPQGSINVICDVPGGAVGCVQEL